VCEPAVIRVLAGLALVACKPQVIELGKPDAAAEAGLPVCACRLQCVSTTVECIQAGSGSTCGADHYCTGSIGICTTTTPAPCGSVQSVCTNSETSTVACGQ